jgi:hypothetical protein
MKLPHSVCEDLRDHVVLESECIDRMYLNVYVPQLQRVGGVVWYLRAATWVSALLGPPGWHARPMRSWPTSSALSPIRVWRW